MHEANCAIAQVVRLPGTIGDALFAEQRLGNCTVSVASRMRVERTDGGTQPFASLFGQLVKGWSLPVPMHRAPQPSGCIGACIEIPIKRQLRYIVGADRWRLFQPDTVLHCADTKYGVPSIRGAPHLAG